MYKPKTSDDECVARIAAAANALLADGGSPAQVVGALTASLVRVAFMTPQAKRTLMLTVELLSEVFGRTPDASEGAKKIRPLI